MFSYEGMFVYEDVSCVVSIFNLVDIYIFLLFICLLILCDYIHASLDNSLIFKYTKKKKKNFIRRKKHYLMLLVNHAKPAWERKHFPFVIIKVLKYNIFMMHFLIKI